MSSELFWLTALALFVTKQSFRADETNFNSTNFNSRLLFCMTELILLLWCLLLCCCRCFTKPTPPVQAPLPPLEPATPRFVLPTTQFVLPTPPTPPQFRRKPRRNHLDLDTADILSYTKRTRRQTAHQRGKKRVAFRSEVFGETITPR